MPYAAWRATRQLISRREIRWTLERLSSWHFLPRRGDPYSSALPARQQCHRREMPSHIRERLEHIRQ
jgi:hypothetical protein